MLFFYDPLLGLVVGVGCDSGRPAQSAADACSIPSGLRRLNDGTSGRGAGDRHGLRTTRCDVTSGSSAASGFASPTPRNVDRASSTSSPLRSPSSRSWRTVDVGAEVGTIFVTIANVWFYLGGFDQISGRPAADVERRSHRGFVLAGLERPFDAKKKKKKKKNSAEVGPAALLTAPESGGAAAGVRRGPSCGAIRCAPAPTGRGWSRRPRSAGRSRIGDCLVAEIVTAGLTRSL